MKNIENNILIAIARSQYAYQLYLPKKYYYQALRIYKANTEVYRLLEAYVYLCDEQIQKLVFDYMMHLEDWFLQFSLEEKKDIAPRSVFVFDRFEDSPAFPKNFVTLIKSQNKK